jgi:hypothetical protein
MRLEGITTDTTEFLVALTVCVFLFIFICFSLPFSDELNVSGHRIGSAELEAALLENHCCAEAAVVGFPHDIKGYKLSFNKPYSISVLSHNTILFVILPCITYF